MASNLIDFKNNRRPVQKISDEKMNFSSWRNPEETSGLGVKLNTESGSSINQSFLPQTQQTNDGMFGGFFEKEGQGGWGMDAFNIAKGAFDVYGNIQKLNLAKDTLDFQKDAFNQQFGVQRKLVQSDLDWRRKARNDRLSGAGGERVIV